MKIQINDHRKIFAVQEEFSKMFPWLKIEFFSKPHKIGGPSPKTQLVPSSKTIGECRTEHDSGTITILPAMTVADLEQAFRDVYGLSVQVFRKSGKSWLETTVTDSWTLEKQNEQGKLLSTVS
jgi:hypothetical protein